MNKIFFILIIAPFCVWAQQEAVQFRLDSTSIIEGQHTLEIRLVFTVHNTLNYDLTYCHFNRGEINLITNDYYKYDFLIRDEFVGDEASSTIPAGQSRMIRVVAPINVTHFERSYKDLYTHDLTFRARGQNREHEKVEITLKDIFINELIPELIARSGD